VDPAPGPRTVHLPLLVDREEDRDLKVLVATTDLDLHRGPDGPLEDREPRCEIPSTAHGFLSSGSPPTFRRREVIPSIDSAKILIATIRTVAIPETAKIQIQTNPRMITATGTQTGAVIIANTTPTLFKTRFIVTS
jgi:hypothetical protein